MLVVYAIGVFDAKSENFLFFQQTLFLFALICIQSLITG